MPPSTAVSLTPLPLSASGVLFIPACPGAAARLWQMHADFCSCALTCRLRVNETWGASSRAAKKGGPSFERDRSQPLGLGHTNGGGMSPDTLTRFCCLDAAYYFEEFVILVTSSNNWLQDPSGVLSAHKHSLIILRQIQHRQIIMFSPGAQAGKHVLPFRVSMR